MKQEQSKMSKDNERHHEMIQEKQDCFIKIIGNCKIFELKTYKDSEQMKKMEKMKCTLCQTAIIINQVEH